MPVRIKNNLPSTFRKRLDFEREIRAAFDAAVAPSVFVLAPVEIDLDRRKKDGDSVQVSLPDPRNPLTGHVLSSADAAALGAEVRDYLVKAYASKP